MLLKTGTVLYQRYRVESPLGQGDLGAVYLGRDMSRDRPVAIKENLDTSLAIQRQFGREARILIGLAHPHLARVTDSFFIPGMGHYLVMDWIEGQSLQEMLDRAASSLPKREVLAWIDQVGDALTYLHTHDRPIIHGDVKPDNIRITPQGEAVLVDLGVARVHPLHSVILGRRTVTPGYSPPEEYGPGSIDARSDVYALGATLYALLTGERPQESVQRIVRDETFPARVSRRFPSSAVRAAVRKALALNPEDRYQTVQDLQAALSGPGGLSGTSTPPPAGYVLTMWVLLAGLLLVSMVCSHFPW